MGTRCGCWPPMGMSAVVVCLVGLSFATSVQARQPWTLAGGLGGGSLFSEDQLGYLRYLGVGAGVSLTGSYRLFGPVELDARAALAGFVSEDPTGSLIELGVGPRLSFGLPGTGIELGPAAHVHVAQTGQDTRPSVALSLRALFPVSKAWMLGPELMIDRVVQTASAIDVSTDADFWLLSAVLAYVPQPDPEPVQVVQERDKPMLRHTVTFLSRAPRRDPPPSPPSRELTMLLDDVVTKRVETRLLSPVLFEFDSTQLTTCGEAALLYARDVLGGLGDRILVEGHADGTGTDEYNIDLSQRRAEFVQRWMIAHGVPADKLEVDAHGERELLVEESDEGRTQLNRRVTFRAIQEPRP